MENMLNAEIVIEMIRQLDAAPWAAWGRDHPCELQKNDIVEGAQIYSIAPSGDPLTKGDDARRIVLMNTATYNSLKYAMPTVKDLELATMLAYYADLKWRQEQKTPWVLEELRVLASEPWVLWGAYHRCVMLMREDTLIGEINVYDSPEHPGTFVTVMHPDTYKTVSEVLLAERIVLDVKDIATLLAFYGQVNKSKRAKH
jgi:hypothetical protein